MADASHLTAPETQVFQPRNRTSAGSLLRPSWAVWWGCPTQKQGLNLPSQPSLGSQSSLRSVEQKRNRNWAVISGVVMNGLYCSGLFEGTGWRRGASGSVLRSFVLCVPFQLLLKALEWWTDVGHICFPPAWLDLAPALTTTSRNILPPWLWGSALSALLEVEMGWKEFQCFALVWPSQTALLTDTFCRRTQFAPDRAISEIIPWAVQDHGVVQTCIHVVAGHHERPFLLGNGQKNVSSPTALEILPNKSFPREFSEIILPWTGEWINYHLLWSFNLSTVSRISV